MDMNEYQGLAQQTAIYRNGIRTWLEYLQDFCKPDQVMRAIEDRLALCYAALAHAGEAGEIAQRVSKMMRDVDFDLSCSTQNHLTPEIGDSLWTLSAVATEAGVEMDDAAGMNVEKLADRKARNVLGGSGDNR